MTDDLSNPDILKALEIAPVEWEEDDRPHRLTVHTQALIVERIPLSMWAEGEWEFERYATPADLDHALKEWLLRLEMWGRKKYGDEFGGVKLWLEPSGNWYCAVVVWIAGGEPAYRICESSTTLIGAVAAAVKKLKPEETEDG